MDLGRALSLLSLIGSTACFIDDTSLFDDDDGAGGAAGDDASGAGATSGAGAMAASGGSTSDGGGGTSDGGGGTTAGGCYEEAFDLDASLTDLEASYQGGQWLDVMLETLDRRYPNGFFVMDQMKNDPWLSNSFPQYFELGSWDGMIQAIDTACHEETHGFDFDSALSLPGQHFYYLGQEVQIAVPKLDFFARNEILALVNEGGSVTSSYDSTYLTSRSGSYDFIFLGDELTAYINGLACATSVADQQTGGTSYRDGAAAHMLYLQLYLRVARTQHAAFYETWKADPAWQQFVRYSWARGRYWIAAALPYPALGINDAAILARVNDPENLAEIAAFTGEDEAVVACSP